MRKCMEPLRFLFLSFTYFLLFILSGCTPNQKGFYKAPTITDTIAPATRITIEAPEHVENPNVVPFFVSINNPLRLGDTLNIFIDKRLAYSIKPLEKTSLSFFSGRVRSFGGKMEAEVVLSNGSQYSTYFTIRQDKSSYIPEIDDRNTEYTEKTSYGQIKALLKNYMGSKNYISKVHFDTSSGEIEIRMTPYVAMNPFIWLKGDFTTSQIRAVTLASSDKDTPINKDKPNYPEATAVSTGTGWLSEYGLFVTNYHVVENASDITVVLSDGTAVPAVAVANDNENDISLLRLTVNDNISGLYGLPLASQSASIGANVFTIGYPVTGLLGKAPKLTNGIISSTSGINDDPRQYQISVPLQPGNSGGPLINNRGEVVGVVTSSLSSLYVAKRTGSLPQNVNFAVKSDYIKPIAMSLDSKIVVEVLPRTMENLESLAERVRDSIILVIAK